MTNHESSSLPLPVRETLRRRSEFLAGGELPVWRIDEAIKTALHRIDRNIAACGARFPAPSSVNGVYPKIANVEWTSGFWTGMLWLAYELSGAERYRAAAASHTANYAERIDRHIATDTHDLGFLYSLSCVAAFKLTGDGVAHSAALGAANLLLARFLPVAGIIQAWGDLNDPAQTGRMIIDCNLNLPLLYWASDTTGDAKYRRAADCHIVQAARHLVRADASTFHTFFMDAKTGAPRYGRTHQGFSDESCWSRGQAWGIYGFPLVYRHNGNAALLSLAECLAGYFLNRLPEDLVCCWDLIFLGPPEPRDSSAAAIATCGLIELARQLPADHPDRAVYGRAARAIADSLITSYAASADDPGEGLIRHGVYHMPNKIGVDECCLWGDYFYLEALTRLRRDWELYW